MLQTFFDLIFKNYFFLWFYFFILFLFVFQKCLPCSGFFRFSSTNYGCTVTVILWLSGSIDPIDVCVCVCVCMCVGVVFNQFFLNSQTINLDLFSWFLFKDTTLTTTTLPLLLLTVCTLQWCVCVCVGVCGCVWVSRSTSHLFSCKCILWLRCWFLLKNYFTFFLADAFAQSFLGGCAKCCWFSYSWIFWFYFLLFSIARECFSLITRLATVVRFSLDSLLDKQTILIVWRVFA